MSQFITVKVTGFNKYSIMIDKIVQVVEVYNGTVYVVTTVGTRIEVDNIFEDIINQLKGQ